MIEGRVGLAERLGAAALDAALSGVAAVVLLVVVATFGGVGLGMRYQEITGGRLTPGSFLDGSFGSRIEERAVAMAEDLQREFESRFTPEQADLMAGTLEREMERLFHTAESREGVFWSTARALASVDETTLPRALDRAFRAIEEERIPGVEPEDLAVVRAQVERFLGELRVAEFLPDVVRYAVAVALAPLLALLAYGLVEAVGGASVGKMLLGLRIGDLEGRRSGPSVTLVRYLIKSGGPLLAVAGVAARSPAILAAAGVEYLVMLFGALAMLGREKRALHDHLARTAVYRSAEMKGPE